LFIILFFHLELEVKMNVVMIGVVDKTLPQATDAPHRTCQSTQRKKMPFRLVAPVWCRP